MLRGGEQVRIEEIHVAFSWIPHIRSGKLEHLGWGLKPKYFTDVPGNFKNVLLWKTSIQFKTIIMLNNSWLH